MRKRSIKGITDRQVDGDLEQIVLQDDEAETCAAGQICHTLVIVRCSPSVHRGGVTKDALESRERLLASVLTSRDAPVCKVR